MQTCEAWSLPPTEMRKLPWKDQVEMIAHVREKGIREAHLAKVRQNISDEKARDKKGGRGRGAR